MQDEVTTTLTSHTRAHLEQRMPLAGRCDRNNRMVDPDEAGRSKKAEFATSRCSICDFAASFAGCDVVAIRVDHCRRRLHGPSRNGSTKENRAPRQV